MNRGRRERRQIHTQAATPEFACFPHVEQIAQLYRHIGGRFLLAIDGTGLYSFRRRHCEHCIETRHDSGAVTYSHKVLVAFIVSDNGYALPIVCEFVENPGAAYDKQDC